MQAAANKRMQPTPSRAPFNTHSWLSVKMKKGTDLFSEGD
jgi:hypothetical protein